MKRSYLLVGAFMMLGLVLMQAQKNSLPSVRYTDNRLVYMSDSLGNQIPDYSYCGYQLSESAIPDIAAKVVVYPSEGDATDVIQNAIDYIADLPLQEDGFRGAILLKEGIYKLSGRLKIQSSGIIFRGSGAKTILKAAGIDRESFIRVIGEKNYTIEKTYKLSGNYVPVNASKLDVEDTRGLKVGDHILVHRPSTKAWIQDMKMVDYGGETGWLGWKPGQRDIYWERQIDEIEGKTLTINIPITASIDQKYGAGDVSLFSWPGRISNIGIENLRLVSAFNEENPKDENHCWVAITMENVNNAWVRQVNFKHFAGSSVALYETSSRITVEDCISTDPVSEIAGQRRNTFFTMGQQTLFLRCYAEDGNHDFATGFCAAGPNAFVQCESVSAHNFSGAIDSWATGVLYDIVSADGQALSFKNRGQDGQGAGWTAANSMFWQCSAGRIECFSPPTAQNYAYGAWAQFAGDGLWYEENSHVNPRSLFFTQLAERLNKQKEDYAGEYLPFPGESTSSPTMEQAQRFTQLAAEPLVLLKDFIQSAALRHSISVDAGQAIDASKLPAPKIKAKETIKSIGLKNGWLTFDSKILTGYQHNVPWWRGNPRPFYVQKSSPAITRFVPGRVGNGYTDNLDEVTEWMDAANIVAVNHNYGLWYDRRRDDHERVKRFDSESWAPFYEQPFERSGQGEAWDRLSKYDLTKYNSWYWNRLNDFAVKAEKKGKLLIHQNYFQHNILEAGAHWADSPWRPANNINQTGFPEPPPYSGDKRIYLAEQFYDISHPVRRELHRAYIRQCLNNFVGRTNVIQSISAEYTGPLHFVEFWLDVIGEWEKETGNHARVALSTTKDVQDAILADKQRSSLIDIIDIRYWAYRSDGSLYNPPGGKNMAPRQHARKVSPGKRSFQSVYRSVVKYRSEYPEKAVIYSEGRYTGFGWAIFMAGGSMPALKVPLPANLACAAVNMVPLINQDDESEVWTLKSDGESMIMYVKSGNAINVDLQCFIGTYNVKYLNPSNGEWFKKQESIKGGKNVKLKSPNKGDVVVWISK